MEDHKQQRNEEPNKNAYVPPHRRNKKPNEEQTNKEPNRNKSSTTNWSRGGVRRKSENTSRFKRNWSRKEDSNSSKTAEEPSVKLNIEENSKKSDFDLYPHPFSARKNERKSLEKFPIPLEALREFITDNEYEELLQAKENQTEIEESNWIYNVDFKVEKDFYINFKGKIFFVKVSGIILMWMVLQILQFKMFFLILILKEQFVSVLIQKTRMEIYNEGLLLLLRILVRILLFVLLVMLILQFLMMEVLSFMMLQDMDISILSMEIQS